MRQLIDQLLPKLKIHAVKKEEAEKAEVPESWDVYDKMVLLLLVMMYDQLNVDLRRQLIESCFTEDHEPAKETLMSLDVFLVRDLMNEYESQ